jgi:hypothetical protein
MGDDEVHGEFRPPAVTRSQRVLPIAGVGRCRVTPEHLVLSGFRASMWHAWLLVFVILALALGIAWAVRETVAPGIDLGKLASAFVVMGVVSLLSVRARATRRPLELAIPWRCVQSIEIHAGLLLIDVSGQKPSGGAFFRPQGDAALAREVLIGPIAARELARGA